MADEENLENSWVSELSLKLSKIEEQRISLLRKCREYKKTIDDKNIAITKLKAELKLERIKTGILSKISNIDIDKIVTEKEEGVFIKNF